MHFALPPKKSAGQDGMFKPRPSSRPMWLRRSRLKHVLLWIVAATGFLMALWKIIGLLTGERMGTPPVVIVTVMKPEGHTQSYLDTIKENREEYAKRHGMLRDFVWRAVEANLVKAMRRSFRHSMTTTLATIQTPGLNYLLCAMP